METTRDTQGADGSGEEAGGRRVGTRTDIGRKRQRNEDFLGVEETPNGLLLVVCDGMGGHEGGERASRLAVEVFVRTVSEGSGTPRELLRLAVEKANAAVYQEAGSPVGRAGMGTTLVAALVRGSDATVANVGDSRAYLLRSSGLSRVTNDHSVVGELVQQGKLSDHEARLHPQRNIITRAIGTRPDVNVDLFDVRLGDGDRLLLASDGLHGLVPDDELEMILRTGGAPERTCDLLIDAALDAGGDDNISVALLAMGDAGAASEPDTDPGAGSSRFGAIAAVSAASGAAASDPAAAFPASASPAPAAFAAAARSHGRVRSRRAWWLLPLVIMTLGVAVWYFWTDDSPDVNIHPATTDSLLRSATDTSSELDGLIDTLYPGGADARFDSLIRLHTQDSLPATGEGIGIGDTLPRRDTPRVGDAVTGRPEQGPAARRRR